MYIETGNVIATARSKISLNGARKGEATSTAIRNIDFRFSYAEADDLDMSATGLSTDNSAETGADSTMLGVFYALGDSTELSLSYIEVSNDTYGTYGTGIGGRGLGTVNGEVEIIALGFLTMF